MALPARSCTRGRVRRTTPRQATRCPPRQPTPQAPPVWPPPRRRTPTPSSSTCLGIARSYPQRPSVRPSKYKQWYVSDRWHPTEVCERPVTSKRLHVSHSYVNVNGGRVRVSYFCVSASFKLSVPFVKGKIHPKNTLGHDGMG